ncbi:hypothetical protein ACQ4LK_25285, partial [Bacillus pumilus]
YERADFLNGRLIFSFRDEKEDLQSTYSLLDIETDGAILSALKKEEHGTGIVIRLSLIHTPSPRDPLHDLVFRLVLEKRGGGG